MRLEESRMNKERNRSDREKIGAARTALAGCPGESARQMYVGLPSTLHPLPRRDLHSVQRCVYCKQRQALDNISCGSGSQIKVAATLLESGVRLLSGSTDAEISS